MGQLNDQGNNTKTLSIIKSKCIAELSFISEVKTTDDSYCAF